MAQLSNILIPTDFSEIARPATILGGALALRLGTKATLLHVLPHTSATRLLGEPYAVWTDSEGEANEESKVAGKLARVAAELPEGIDTALIWGHAVDGMCSFARDASVDLIVLGAYGRSALTTVSVGSIAERVARCAHCSVLVARTRGALPKRIVVGTDLSSASRRGIEIAAELASRCDARLTLAHVQPGAGEGNDEASPALERELDELAKSCGVPMDSRLIVADHPVHGLTTCVEEQDADLLVVAAQGLSAMERMLIGSVSERLARYAKCSVLIAR